MKTHKLAWLAALAFGAAGCIDAETTVTVKPDGSGTIGQKIVMSQEAVAQMRSMAAAFDTSGKPFSFYDEENLKTQAAKLGEGVTYVSSEPIVSEAGEGWTVVYAFTDVTKLRLNSSPEESAPGGGEGAEEQEEPIVFRFEKGEPSVLTIVSPENPKTETPEAAESSPEELEQMRTCMKGLRVKIAIVVDGEIIETNAEHRDGSTVTLMEMDFAGLLADEARFQKFATARPENMEAAKELMKGMPGVKVESADEVTIRFK